MNHIILEEERFEELSNILEQIKLDDDEYIPSDEDILDYIQEHPEKYYLYLLWYSENKPKPESETEKKQLKKVIKAINRAIQID